MRIAVDTNIAFSAILNTNNQIARIFLQPKNRFNFYSTEQLLTEIEEHKSKLKRISKFTDADLTRSIFLITHRIRFINIGLILKEKYLFAETLTHDVDPGTMDILLAAVLLLFPFLSPEFKNLSCCQDIFEAFTF